jgi:hypothetical protein
MRRAEPGPWWLIPIAAGERIVAFARPGKPSGIARFDGQLNALRQSRHPLFCRARNGF